MHAECYQFVEMLSQRYPAHFSGDVLEFGSLNINGSVRDHFSDPQTYIGIDCHEGEDVDQVSLFHEYVGPHVDVVISCEALEHDPYSRWSIECMVEHLRPGGLLILTAGGPKRERHGVGEYGPSKTHYANFTREKLLDYVESGWPHWSVVATNYERNNRDVQLWAIKSQGPS